MLHELIIDQFGNYIIQRILFIVEREKRSLLIHYIVNWYPEIKALSFGPRLISKLHERYQEFTLLIIQNYGWDTTQETVSYFHLNGKDNNNNFYQTNINNNININSFNNNMFDNNNINNNKDFIKRTHTMPQMIKNFGNNIIANRMNNNNCMNFKNKSNVGNINFIQMNNYMLSPGLNNQNNSRLALNNSQLFNNLNNINNLDNLNNINNNQIIKDINEMNPNVNNNLLYQREQHQNYFNNMNNNLVQRINSYGPDNIPTIQSNNMGNNNQNMLNYQQYLNMTFPNINK